MPALSLQTLWKAIEQYEEQFNHPVPAWVGQDYLMEEIAEMINRALKTGKPVQRFAKDVNRPITPRQWGLED